MRKKIFIVLLGLSVLFAGCTTNTVDLDGEKMSSHVVSEAGQYGVGYKKLFVTDETQVFNAWGEKHGNDEQKAFFKELNAFEPHTVVTQMWYPADKEMDADSNYLGEEPHASGDDVYMKDLYISDVYFAEESAKEILKNLTREDSKNVKALLKESTQESKDAVSSLVDDYLNRKLDSKHNAPIADGKFPVVVMAHGLGNAGYHWNEAAEALASQGYIVVAPTFVSDGRMPEVFDNPDSVVGQKSPEEIHAHYTKLQHQANVLQNFFKYLYNIEPDLRKAEEEGDLSVLMKEIQAAKAPNDGGDRATEMMGDLFNQRVSDVQAIIEELKVMNASGEFANKIDLDNIGMTGHSLGSVTTMIALERLEDVKVGLGVNNGVPLKWEPDDLEDNDLTKPLLLLHGQEDDFLNLVFKTIWQELYIPQGGDINKTYALSEEREVPTPENPDPILTATYNRAKGPKVAVKVLNSDHENMVEDIFTFYPTDGDQEWKVSIEKPRMLSKGLFNTGLFAEKFNLISSEKLDDGYVMNQAGYIRDYYYKTWFGYHLKGIEAYHDYVLETPFEEGIEVKSDDF